MSLTLKMTSIPKAHSPHGLLDPPPFSVIALSQQCQGAELPFDIHHSFQGRKGTLRAGDSWGPSSGLESGASAFAEKACSLRLPAALTKQRGDASPASPSHPPSSITFHRRLPVTQTPPSLLLPNGKLLGAGISNRRLFGRTWKCSFTVIGSLFWECNWNPDCYDLRK